MADVTEDLRIPSLAQVKTLIDLITASDVGALALDCSNSLSSTHDYDGVSIKNQGQSKEARYWQDSSGNVHITSYLDDSNYTTLTQKVLEGDVNLADLLSLHVEGTGSYRIYGEHNKPTPAQLSAMSMGYITSGTNIDTLPDGIYFYNGWASPHITCTAGLPFTNKQGIWIKKTPYGTDGGTTNREDTVINCETGAVYTMHSYDGNWHTMYGSHNKPSGSYTGNGSATERRIPVGGIGWGVLLYSGQGMAIVTPFGAIIGGHNGVSVKIHPEVYTTVSTGELVIASTNNTLNLNGNVVNYYRL